MSPCFAGSASSVRKMICFAWALGTEERVRCWWARIEAKPVDSWPSWHWNLAADWSEVIDCLPAKQTWLAIRRVKRFIVASGKVTRTRDQPKTKWNRSGRRQFETKTNGKYKSTAADLTCFETIGQTAHRRRTSLTLLTLPMCRCYRQLFCNIVPFFTSFVHLPPNINWKHSYSAAMWSLPPRE